MNYEEILEDLYENATNTEIAEYLNDMLSVWDPEDPETKFWFDSTRYGEKLLLCGDNGACIDLGGYSIKFREDLYYAWEGILDWLEENKPENPEYTVAINVIANGILEKIKRHLEDIGFEYEERFKPDFFIM